jgi:hypothetical protein
MKRRASHKGRGYEVAKGQYLIVEDAELEGIEAGARAKNRGPLQAVPVMARAMADRLG